MKDIKEVTIEWSKDYRIYKSRGMYFLDLHRPIIHSYKTLAGARETAYYMGLRESKK